LYSPGGSTILSGSFRSLIDSSYVTITVVGVSVLQLYYVSMLKMY